MDMQLGDRFRVTLFGESHGQIVGSLVTGMPSGVMVDTAQIEVDMVRRSTSNQHGSGRKEGDEVEILSGTYDGITTGAPVLLLVRNQDHRSRDYSFLPHMPRPGHADYPQWVKSSGVADLRGGGTASGRLTVGLVASSSLLTPLIDDLGWDISARTFSVGGSNSPDEWASLIERTRNEGDSLGSAVELKVTGLEIGLGEPWFSGLEPVLAKGLFAIPGVRGVEFGRGFSSSLMRGSEHNDAWQLSDDKVTQGGDEPDGALGGLSTGAPLVARVYFKPPSSIGLPQQTLHLPSGEMRTLSLEGRHDPVISFRAEPVVEAVARILLYDLHMMN